MDCGKIRDMMQLYVEDLTSEESKLWIEEHVEHCEECKKKLEELKAEEDIVKEWKKEVRPFRKLRRKLWMRCVFDIIAIFLVIACIVAMVAGGIWGWNKIDNYSGEKYVKQVTKLLLEGNVEDYVGHISGSVINGLALKEEAQWEAICVEQFQEVYEQLLKGKKAKISGVEISTACDESDYKTTDYSVILKIDGENFRVDYCNLEGGLRFIGLYGEDTENDDNNIYGSSLYDFTGVLSCYQTNLVTKMKDLSEKTEENEVPFLLTMGEEDNLDYANVLWDNLKEVFSKGMTIEESAMTDLAFDSQKEAFTGRLIWKFKTKENKVAYLQQEVLLPSLQAVDQDAEIIDNGITAEEKASLENIFVVE